jgi:hypothetical protein
VILANLLCMLKHASRQLLGTLCTGHLHGCLQPHPCRVALCSGSCVHKAAHWPSHPWPNGFGVGSVEQSMQRSSGAATQRCSFAALPHTQMACSSAAVQPCSGAAVQQFRHAAVQACSGRVRAYVVGSRGEGGAVVEVGVGGFDAAHLPPHEHVVGGGGPGLPLACHAVSQCSGAVGGGGVQFVAAAARGRR